MTDQSTTSCQAVIDSLDAFALGTLDDEEAAGVQRHLASCPRCQAALLRATRLVQGLALAVKGYDPPPSLKQELLKQIPGQDISSRDMTQQMRPVCLIGWAAAVALALLTIALGIWDMGLRREVAQQTSKVAQLRTQMDETKTLLAVLTDATAQVHLVGTAEAPQAWARLYLCPEGQEAVLVWGNLPTLPADRTYQLWLIDANGRRTNGGIFAANGAATYMIVHAPLPFSSYRGLGVTVEPAGGSTGPTGPRVLAGTM